MSTLLTKAEISELTGAVRATKQCEILRQHRIGFVKRCDGYPAVTWDAVNRAMSGTSHSAQEGGNVISPDYSGMIQHG